MKELWNFACTHIGELSPSGGFHPMTLESFAECLGMTLIQAKEVTMRNTFGCSFE